MVASQVKVGQPIEIHITRDKVTYRLVSKVENVERDKIFISLISAARRIFQFKNTDEVEVFYREKERIWEWKGVSGYIDRFDGRQVHVLEAEGEASVFNRRNNFRVSVGNVCDFTHTIYEQGENEDDLKCVDRIKFKAIVKDISENGVAIIAKYPLKIYDQIEFEFPLDNQKITCSAQVIRESMIEDLPDKRIYGCVLTVSNNELSKYVMDKQRKFLQNTRGGNSFLN